MNVKRFTARTSRDALSLVRQALGDDAVVLSTKPSGDGVEVLAMAPEGMRQVEQMAATAPVVSAKAAAPAGKAAKAAAAKNAPVEEDVAKLSMSTLSFQDYVRERLLRRRSASQAARNNSAAQADEGESRFGFMNTVDPHQDDTPVPAVRMNSHAAPASVLEQRMNEQRALDQRMAEQRAAEQRAHEQRLNEQRANEQRIAEQQRLAAEQRAHEQRLADERAMEQRIAERAAAAAPAYREAPRHAPDLHMPALADAPPAHVAARREQEDMMNELRSMKGLIEDRFGALAFMEKLQRHPAQARMTQKLLDCGFSPALIRKLGDSLPADVGDESAWAATVLERNLLTAENEAPLEDQGGVYALIGATGVGKTTTTAKIAAAFATKYGAANLGLITLDAYRIGAHEQLRAYGRILGVPVHTAHDRASLEDLLELLAGKKMVLIDTAGMAQRDARTRELMDMLSHRSIQKLLVVNAASQGETIEDVMVAYRASSCCGVVLSKMDEAVKLGPALDTMIRHRTKVIGIANGQRVPEDWHRLSSNALIHRALRAGGSAAYKLDANDVTLIFAAPNRASAAPAARGALHA